MAFDQERVNAQLRESANSIMERTVLASMREWLRMSSNHMAKFWPRWDDMEKVYRGYRVRDEEDRKASQKGQPQKIIVPFTYAQTQTALAFLMSVYTERRHLFELKGRGPEDVRNALGMQMDLDYQLQRQRFFLTLYSWLLDALRYGVGVVKAEWRTETEQVRRRRTAMPPPDDLMAAIGGMVQTEFDQEGVTEDVIEEMTSYEGNKIYNVSPYSFYPDPTSPLSKFQDGQFVGHEEVSSLAALRKREREGLYHGVQHIPREISASTFDARKRRVGADGVGNYHALGTAKIPDGKNIVTEVQFYMSPHDMRRKDPSMDFLGDEKYPVRFVATMVNDSKLVSLERLNYIHSRFTYSVGEYSPDTASFYNPGLAQTIDELQDLITWFLNSHVVNVRKVIQNQLVGDQSKLNMDDVNNDRRFIRLKDNVTSVPSIDRVIKQLDVRDVTAGHVNDIDTLSKLLYVTTGVNENALGQYSPGRRSATEARAVNSAAAARLKMHAQLFYYQAMEPLAEQLIANTRQARTEEVYAAILGEKAGEYPYEQVILTPEEAIVGGYDFIPFDPTTMSEKAFAAQQMQEILEMVLQIQDPQSLQHLDVDPARVLDHWFELVGIKNREDLRFNANGMQAQVVQDGQIPQGAEPVDDIFGNMLMQGVQ